MINYLIELAVVHVALFFGYWLFLRKEQQYARMRSYLIASTILALAIPLLKLPKLFSFSRDPLVMMPMEAVSSVKKGFEEAMKNGVLAGYPLQSMRVRLFDGSIHDEDSHAQDFELVASLGFKQAAKKASPKLLEPVMRVDILTPEEYIGAITSDLNRRRGIIREIGIKANAQWIDAEVPLANLFGYVTALRTLSSGRASASLTFCRYQLVPENIAQPVLAKTVM